MTMIQSVKKDLVLFTVFVQQCDFVASVNCGDLWWQWGKCLDVTAGEAGGQWAAMWRVIWWLAQQWAALGNPGCHAVQHCLSQSLVTNQPP